MSQIQLVNVYEGLLHLQTWRLHVPIMVPVLLLSRDALLNLDSSHARVHEALPHEVKPVRKYMHASTWEFKTPTGLSASVERALYLSRTAGSTPGFFMSRDT